MCGKDELMSDLRTDARDAVAGVHAPSSVESHSVPTTLRLGLNPCPYLVAAATLEDTAATLQREADELRRRSKLSGRAS